MSSSTTDKELQACSGENTRNMSIALKPGMETRSPDNGPRSSLRPSLKHILTPSFRSRDVTILTGRARSWLFYFFLVSGVFLLWYAIYKWCKEFCTIGSPVEVVGPCMRALVRRCREFRPLRSDDQEASRETSASQMTLIYIDLPLLPSAAPPFLLFITVSKTHTTSKKSHLSQILPKSKLDRMKKRY